MSYLKDNPDQLKNIEEQLYSIILPNNDKENNEIVDEEKENKKNKKVEENV